MEAPAEVLQLPDSADRKLRSDRHNATVHFVDAEWALIADGTGRLLVVHTGDRTQDGKWKVGQLRVLPKSLRNDPEIRVCAFYLSARYSWAFVMFCAEAKRQQCSQNCISVTVFQKNVSRLNILS